MSHEVTIDDEAVDAGFAEFESDTGPAKSVQGVMLPEPTANEWKAIAKMAATMLANAVTPNWQVPAETQNEWADALAGCLDQLFPGGLANIANWGPWAKLAYASVMWGLCGIDYSTGMLKPLRVQAEGEGQEGAGTGGQGGDAEPSGSVHAPTASAGRHMMG